MKITSLLTYRDGGGKRRLRDYVKVTLGILMLVVAVSAVGLYNHYQLVAEVMSAPHPLDIGLIPSPTEEIAEPVSPVEQCPSNPSDWTLTDSLLPGSNLKGIAPQCVPDSLERAAAWFYSTSVFGKSRSEATRLLGFSNIPIAYSFNIGQLTVLTDFKDEPQKVDLRFPSDNSNLAEWRIDSNERPAAELSFSGCFRTTKIDGGKVISWGDGYPVVCQYSGDFRSGYYVGNVNGKVVTAPSDKNVRRFMWFGYAGNGNWIFLGIARDWEYDLSQIQNRGTSTINPDVMNEKYGINSSQLPENWIAFAGQEYADAFLKELRESK